MGGPIAGKVACITGAARGQGRAHAVRLAQEGADIIAVDACGPIGELRYDPATEGDLAETARLVEHLGRRVVTAKVDIRDFAALQAAFQRGSDELGSLDILIANAGICGWGLLWELAPKSWQDMIDVNLTGTWNSLKAAAQLMMSRGQGGAMVVTSSAMGLKAVPGMTHYVAAKHGLVGLVKAAAIELAPFGIRVNSIHPWAVDTLMSKEETPFRMMEEHPVYQASFGQVITEPGVSDPSDIANAAFWLVSDEARTVTGIQLSVDHGATIV
jgi:SDR family mycofactocin-dependent oxidoreductase